MHFNLLLTSFILILKRSQIWPVVALSSWPLCPFWHFCLIFGACPYFLAQKDAPARLILSQPHLWNQPFLQRSLIPFSGERPFWNQDLGARVLIAFGMLEPPGPQWPDAFNSIFICLSLCWKHRLYGYLWFQSNIRESILTFLPLHIYNCSDSENLPLSSIHLMTGLIPLYTTISHYHWCSCMPSLPPSCQGCHPRSSPHNLLPRQTPSSLLRLQHLPPAAGPWTPLSLADSLSVPTWWIWDYIIQEGWWVSRKLRTGILILTMP